MGSPASSPLITAAYGLLLEHMRILGSAKVRWLDAKEVMILLTKPVEYLLPVTPEPPNLPSGAV